MLPIFLFPFKKAPQKSYVYLQSPIPPLPFSLEPTSFKLFILMFPLKQLLLKASNNHHIAMFKGQF